MKKLINLITFSRVILGLLFFYFVLFDFNEFYLIIVFILTGISDISDGRLARKYNLATDEGGKFDVICDFIFIILSTSSLVLADLIPPWFLIVIILKLIEFFKTSNESLRYDEFGHIVALMFYAFPIFAILIGLKEINLILSIFITICAIISSTMRIRGVK